MKKILIALLCLTLLPALALANGLNLNSLGSRALAMGGAFVGLADDYSAIYWNPAGMSQFTSKTFGLYGTDIIPSGSYLLEIPTAIGTLTAVDAKTQAKHYLSGLAAYYHPINDKMVAGIGVYVPSGLGAAWAGDDFVMATSPFMRSYEWNSRIGLITIAPGLSYKISDMISVGAALNVNYAMFDLKRWANAAGSLDLGQFDMSVNGWGFGATFGVLVKPSDMISIGASFRTASSFTLKGQTTIANLNLVPLGPSLYPPNSSNVEFKLSWPMWLAAGVAVKPIDKLIITGDLQWTKWSSVDEIDLEYANPLWQIIMATSGQDVLPLLWKDALQIRFGAEYKVTQAIALRAGYYIDPSPAPDATMNVLLPSFDFNVLTFGVGYGLNSLNVDLGFEYLMGKDRTIQYLDTLPGARYPHAQPGKYGMNIVVPNISVSYKF
ncbi:MAG: outer membrane protein transport protein [Candidatus Aminicenantales bacterium]